MKKLTSLSIAAAGMLAAVPASADTVSGISPITASGDLDIVTVITNIINWVLLFSGVVAVLFLILGGLQYITAAGNEKRIENAKNTILYAVIGLIVMLLSFVIVAFVSQNVGKVVGQ